MKNAAIRIVGPKGKVMDHRTFDVPLADLREQPLALGIPKTPIYSLEVDHSRRDASFAGPAYHFFSVRGGKFDWVGFTDQGANKRSEFVPTVNAANQFSLVPRADRKGKDFLLTRCDPQQSPPGPDGDKSATTYTRVHYEGGEWRATQDTKPGDQCRGAPSNGTQSNDTPAVTPYAARYPDARRSPGYR